MTYKIYEDGNLINTISASSAFVEKYCEKYGYTYEKIETPTPEVETDVWAELAQAIAEGVNSI